MRVRKAPVVPRRWIVEWRDDDDDTTIYGPYLKAEAESVEKSLQRLADKHNNEVEEGGSSFIHVNAYPIRPFDPEQDGS